MPGVAGWCGHFGAGESSTSSPRVTSELYLRRGSEPFWRSLGPRRFARVVNGRQPQQLMLFGSACASIPAHNLHLNILILKV